MNSNMGVDVNKILYNDVMNQKILIVDDEKPIQKLIKKILKKYGNKVDVANNGLEGLKMYKENDYLYVISDGTMPVMDGPEMYFNIKRYDPKANFIFITGDKSLLEEQISNEMIFQKPLNLAQFNYINDKIQEKKSLYQ